MQLRFFKQAHGSLAFGPHAGRLALGCLKPETDGQSEAASEFSGNHYCEHFRHGRVARLEVEFEGFRPVWDVVSFLDSRMDIDTTERSFVLLRLFF